MDADPIPGAVTEDEAQDLAAGTTVPQGIEWEDVIRGRRILSSLVVGSLSIILGCLSLLLGSNPPGVVLLIIGIPLALYGIALRQGWVRMAPWL